ncbi:hypothetical protein ASPVEDRAFT_211412 [Aspergillus versicolor CBS 583.65]|uniref:BZIP domain-containing protein n=1 Tax=Aspergillus versicolor CBS 583.65 TaxID=1036611 RepID=A0A1L9P346_ASPVE|nr:uncharacterized protein ASPVEDRAFT_211412 [Aspergillus versicolor CBS 583.65]OJI95970.1 hypothetical protein ASPVEDRAFT_211412 [Aspergillus versicolor CBS 583.65]
MSRSNFFPLGAPFISPNMSGTISASEMQRLQYPSDIPGIAGNPYSLSPEEHIDMWDADPTMPTVNPSCIVTSGVNNVQSFSNLAGTKVANNFSLSSNKPQLGQMSTNHQVQNGQITPPSDRSPVETHKPAELHSSIEHSSGVPAKRRRGSSARSRGGSRSASTRASTSVEPSSPGDNKQERTRARNRLAASKCRQKKKEQNTQLESRFEYERIRREELTRTVNSLRDDIVAAKNQLLEHSECDHESIKAYIQNMAKRITVQDGQPDYSAVPTQYYGCGTDTKQEPCAFDFGTCPPTA